MPLLDISHHCPISSIATPEKKEIPREKAFAYFSAPAAALLLLCSHGSLTSSSHLTSSIQQAAALLLCNVANVASKVFSTLFRLRVVRLSYDMVALCFKL